MRKKLFTLLLALLTCLGLTAAVSASAEEAEGSSTARITFSELKPGYYIGAIWDGDELLTLFDYTVDSTGTMETTVELGKVLPTDKTVQVGISGKNADAEPIPPQEFKTDPPANSNKPSTPDDSNKPNTPDDSNKPSTPDDSNKPNTPDDSNKPDKPSTPGTSGGSSSGGGGGTSGGSSSKPSTKPSTATPAPTSPTPAAPSSPKRFTDVPSDAYYYDAVMWASENGITSGVGGKKFKPDDPCTRAQIVTFLWRAAGSPKAEETSRFKDIPSDFYARDAIQWAVSEGITKGMGKKSFRPAQPCTRAQAVTFLCRAAGSPAETHSSRFNDVPAESYYADAVQWAVNNQITKGMGSRRFQPDSTCSRAQIVTFLYRNRQK